jgi:hypothetical protein
VTDADRPAQTPTRKVTLARAYTDADGKSHKADATLTLPRSEANRLLFAGLARVPATTKKEN